MTASLAQPGGAGPAAQTGPAEDARAHLLAIGRSALLALVELVPRAVWRGFKGSLGGFFLMGFLGLAVAGAAAALSALGVAPQPRWLVLVNLAWVPFVLAVAGAYTGGINGFLSSVSEEVERRGLAARIFAIVKPACLAVARRVGGGGPASSGDVAAELRAAVDQRLDADAPQKPMSLAERAELFLASRSRRLLCLSVLRPVAKARDRETAVRELETFGVQRLSLILTDTIEDLFSMQVLTAAILALVAAAAPVIVYSLLR